MPTAYDTDSRSERSFPWIERFYFNDDSPVLNPGVHGANFGAWNARKQFSLLSLANSHTPLALRSTLRACWARESRSTPKRREQSPGQTRGERFSSFCISSSNPNCRQLPLSSISVLSNSSRMHATSCVDKLGRRAAMRLCDDLPAPHSMTSSASRRTEVATVTPSASAVFRLTTSWKRAGRSMGCSAASAPSRILRVRAPAWRKSRVRSGP